MADEPGDGAHAGRIADQFTRQAEPFARAPALHGDAVLSLLVEAARLRGDEEALDVACGPGTVVAAFAPRVRRAVGVDATPAMLVQARELAARRGLTNVEWVLGDVYRLPFPAGAFDVVSCRYAFHHLERPREALWEMVRVCRPGGRIVLCDGVAPDDPSKAEALNRMERHRDPSTVAYRPLAALLEDLEAAGLPPPAVRRFELPVEREGLIARSFPAGDDRALLRRMIDDSVDGDAMGMNARRKGETVVLAYPSVVLTSERPPAAGVTPGGA